MTTGLGVAAAHKQIEEAFAAVHDELAYERLADGADVEVEVVEDIREDAQALFRACIGIEDVTLETRQCAYVIEPPLESAEELFRQMEGEA